MDGPPDSGGAAGAGGLLSPGASLLATHARGRNVRDLDAAGSVLVGARLEGLRADGLGLAGADLSGAILRDARLSGCDLRGVRLAGADLVEATLRQCILDDAHAPNARLEGARLEDSSARGADFARACLRDTHLSETSLARASLREVDLTAARGDGTELRGADLAGASLARARLVDADFRGADLTGADLSGGDFRGADFRGALLNDVNWADAVLSGAQFDEGTTVVEARPITQEVPVTGMGASDVLAEALTRLVGQAIASSAQGAPRIDRELEGVADAWRAWQSREGADGGPEAVALLEGLRRTLGPSGLVPPELSQAVSRFLGESGRADDLDPPEEWKAWLTQLLPGLSTTKPGESLDTLASGLLDALRAGPGRKKPRNPQ